MLLLKSVGRRCFCTTRVLVQEAKKDDGRIRSPKSGVPGRTLNLDRMRMKVKKRRYSYEKGPNDPTLISAQRAQYLYNLAPSDFDKLKPIRLRTAHDSSGSAMICYLESDVIALAKKVGSLDSKNQKDTGFDERVNFVVATSFTSPGSNTKKEGIDDPLSENENKVISTAVAANLIILSAKVYAWICTGSSCVLAECIHSSIDLISQMILVAGNYIARQNPTDKHPYGLSKAIYVGSLIGNVFVLALGASFSIMEGVHSMYRNNELASFNWALWIMGLSFLLESYSLFVAAKWVVRQFRTVKEDSIFSKKFISYLYDKANPLAVAVIAEDASAMAGSLIAFLSLLATRHFKSTIPDSIGSILVGVIMIMSIYFITRRNIRVLMEESVGFSTREKMIDFIESDKIVRSVHDVKATVLGSNMVKFKAEINYNGGQLARAYLRSQNKRHLLKRIQRIKTQRQMKRFIIGQGNKLLNCLGRENDRLERKIRKKFPELRHIDLETL